MVQQNRKALYAQLKISAQDAPNRGAVFKFEEFRQLVTTTWSPDCSVSFPVFILKRFMAVTYLLGALRSKQFERFRSGGLEAIEYLRDNRDDH